MEEEKKVLYFLIGIGLLALLIFSGAGIYNYLNKDIDCAHSKYGYLKTYGWIDKWSESCQREGKIFTVESDEEGVIINPRCATEAD